VPLALALRRRPLSLGVGAGLLLGTALLGGELLPAAHSACACATEGPQLSVMSFNVYGGNATPAQVVATIRDTGADLVALQELNPEVAAAVERELVGVYPVMLLAPQPGVTGMGLLSRYPLRALGSLPGQGWLGAPQVVELAMGAQKVVVLNFHAIPPMVTFAGSSTEAVRERERQAAAIVALAAEHKGPLLAMGDFNTTRHHYAYQIVNAALGDAWAVQGGPGFTWPVPGTSDLPLPMTRIDYIFHSAHWTPRSAAVGAMGSGSDHMPITAILALTQP
jgi:vancomycin resistance protein VanJ